MTLMVQVNYVDLPFTVKDSKGQLVPGLQQRDVQVFENGLRQHISFFTTDSFPLSVALVVDQSMTYDNMLRVNDSLGALQGAFTRYDEVEVFTYNNGPKLVTDFTGAQSARLTQAIEISKGAGRDPLLAGMLSGPLSQTTVINNQNFDPNTASQRGHSGIQLNPPKELHTLNDAILAAAVTLSKKPIERRRVIYVISDGKEYGSTAKYKDVLTYLETNRIEVDGTAGGRLCRLGSSAFSTACTCRSPCETTSCPRTPMPPAATSTPSSAPAASRRASPRSPKRCAADTPSATIRMSRSSTASTAPSRCG